MKRRAFYWFVALSTFAVGTFLASLLLLSFQKPNEASEIPAVSEHCFLKLESEDAKIGQHQSKENKLFPQPNKNQEKYGSIAGTLEKLVAFKDKKGEQSFYVSQIKSEDGQEFSYAYWKEDNSIYVLNSIDRIEDDIDWFDYKNRIDLRKDVVPKGKYENLGCCLVEDKWVKQIISDCKKGYKLIIKK